mmetsp:Transcript_73951/g.197092  ORF Transcript_73951/g.197092 Transcript_73951/m.197092 type:complete len:284 (+) Transcript_73951:2457-3308(+)
MWQYHSLRTAVNVSMSVCFEPSLLIFVDCTRLQPWRLLPTKLSRTCWHLTVCYRRRRHSSRIRFAFRLLPYSLWPIILSWPQIAVSPFLMGGFFCLSINSAVRKLWARQGVEVIDSHLKRKIAPDRVSDELRRFLSQSCPFRLQVINEREHQAFKEVGDAAQASGAHWVTIGSIGSAVSPECTELSGSFKMQWRCPCGLSGEFSKYDISDHCRHCVAAQMQQKAEEAIRDCAAVGGAHASPAVGDSALEGDGQERGWKCDVCGCQIASEKTMRILTHRRSHGL